MFALFFAVAYFLGREQVVAVASAGVTICMNAREWSAQEARDFIDTFREEDFAMSYTMEDFKRDFLKEHLAKLTPQEQEQVLQSLPPERRLAGLSADQIRQYLERLTAGGPAAPRKPRRKK